MSKMRTFKRREFETFLKKQGFLVARHQGSSHIQYKHPATGKNFTVATSRDEFQSGIIRQILNELGIELEDFVSHFYGDKIGEILTKGKKATLALNQGGEDISAVDEHTVSSGDLMPRKPIKKTEIPGDTSVDLFSLSDGLQERCTKLGIATAEQLFSLLDEHISAQHRAEIQRLANVYNVTPTVKRATLTLLPSKTEYVEGIEGNKRSPEERRFDNMVRGLERKRLNEQLKMEEARAAQEKAMIDAIHDEIRQMIEAHKLGSQKLAQRMGSDGGIFNIVKLRIFLMAYPRYRKKAQPYEMAKAKIKGKRPLEVKMDIYNFIPDGMPPEAILPLLADYRSKGFVISEDVMNKAIGDLDLRGLLLEQSSEGNMAMS